MKWRHSDRSEADYKDAPLRSQNAFDKQARLLSANLLHPSIHVNKYWGFHFAVGAWQNLQITWQARVNKDWRFYFQIEDDTYIVVRIVPHPK
jgi:plasmid maintenance system killer protein